MSKAVFYCNWCKEDFSIERILQRQVMSNLEVTESYFICPHCNMEYPCFYTYRNKVYRTYQDVEVFIHAR